MEMICAANTGDGEFDYDRELESLKCSVQQAQDKFVGQWTSSYRRAVEEADGHHEKRMKKKEELLTKAESQLAELQASKQRTKEMQEEKATDWTECDEKMRSTKAETDGLLLERERLARELAQEKEANEEQKQTLATRQKVTETAVEELQKSMSFFSNRLALQLKKVSGSRLQFVFSCIDEKDPARQFYFFVRIGDKRRYEVTDCEPSVKDLDSLVKKLEDTNNFRSFVITLRRRFREMV